MENIFREPMATSRMRELLAANAPGVLKLRDLAGYKPRKPDDCVSRR